MSLNALLIAIGYNADMNKNIEKVLKIWHTHFEVEENQYSEFEDSDIEYFVGCLLYNHFEFLYALDTMKTIDLSYDFLQGCGNEYDEVLELIKSIKIDEEAEKINFLLNFIEKAKDGYSEDECYLLNRLELHTSGIKQRFELEEKAKIIDFKAPLRPSANPLLR